ncbi:MAG: exodeoxyribonuclease III [Propionibacteriaceae bacterium]|jgi:exodeoxyribonuclease-3|nr:exodeoxyribonuclease III [Propionibacteriaceae bacterium]
MLVASLNANGIRAAARRGFPEWLARRNPDILGVQEMRCPEAEIPDVFGGYHLSYHQGNLPGRNGVALATRKPPAAVRRGFGHDSDGEGRYIEVDLPGVTVASLYLPKGDAPELGDAAKQRYDRKMDFMAAFAGYLPKAAAAAAGHGREFLVMGDFNIANTNADLKNWKANQKASGFLPEERDWFTALLAPGTVIDVVRALHPEQPGPYSWWSWRGKAFDNDAGWRIDYQLATPVLAAQAIAGGTDRDASYAARISDHAPVWVEYGLTPSP